MSDHEALLTFWFGTLQDGLASEQHRRQWFTSSTEFDARCRSEFSNLLVCAADGGLSDWLSSPRGRLAFIVLCDQLPRNVHRGGADAFAWDGLALKAAKQGIELGVDRQLAIDERSFFYMPFEHSENLIDQHTSVGLFSALRDQSPADRRNLTGNNLRFAQKHRDIIQRFARFPHRNATLGRPSNAQETQFIEQGDGFGQL